MATITKKQLADYEQLCKDRNNGRILTPDGLRFICAAYEYDPEKIGKHMLETLAKFNGLEIDDINRSVRKQKQDIDLTFTEFEILYLLANNPGRVFSKEQIYDIVWKESYSGDYNIIMSHIRNIREKIEDNPSKPIYIQTVWGVGYRFNQKMVK